MVNRKNRLQINNKGMKQMSALHHQKPSLMSNGEFEFCLQEGKIALYPFGIKELYSTEYLKWMNDADITKTIGRFDYLMPVSRKKLVEYYNSIDRENTVFLAIYLSTTRTNKKSRKGIFIGTLKIYDVDKLARRASIGIVIGDKQKWGRGYARTAIHIAMRYIFEVLGLNKITAGYLANNIGIEKAFQKNGFQREAIFKEQAFFAGELVDHIFVCKFRG
jgi:[ribosomal protein S5]-alanine N-acetyltransferase